MDPCAVLMSWKRHPKMNFEHQLHHAWSACLTHPCVRYTEKSVVNVASGGETGLARNALGQRDPVPGRLGQLTPDPSGAEPVALIPDRQWTHSPLLRRWATVRDNPPTAATLERIRRSPLTAHGLGTVTSSGRGLRCMDDTALIQTTRRTFSWVGDYRPCAGSPCGVLRHGKRG